MSAAALLSEITHLASRLQSVGMAHARSVRMFAPGDSVETLSREAYQLQQLAESLSFKVGQLQASIASEVRRPRLEEHVTPGRAMPEAERLQLSGMLTDSEGGECA